jgi:Spy/CpxP family protein refolding chaperone
MTVSVRTVLADNRPTWHNPRVLLLLLTVFLCGAAAGILGTKLVMPTAAPRAADKSWTGGGREMTIEFFKKELDLTPEQAAEVETVLDDYVMYYQVLQGQMDDWKVEGKKRILQILKPEQRKRFEKLMGAKSGK